MFAQAKVQQQESEEWQCLWWFQPRHLGALQAFSEVIQ